jgi:hypothetical protein
VIQPDNFSNGGINGFDAIFKLFDSSMGLIQAAAK